MRRLIISIAGALALAILAPTAALADGYNPCDGPERKVPQECPQDPPRETCPPLKAALRIGFAHRGDNVQTVTVTASNDNIATNIGSLDASLVVTYQANRSHSDERTIIATFVEDGGGTFSATFDVRKWRDVSGRVTAYIEDVGCDGVNEAVALS
jgi:hypothetical protein